MSGRFALPRKRDDLIHARGRRERVMTSPGPQRSEGRSTETAMNILTIAGGVALILFAVRFLRKGLERIFGHRLHAWIEGMTQRSRTGSTTAGIAFGAAAPSSTAQTLLTLKLLDQGRLPPDRMLLFLLGANIGITITVQLLAFRLFDYYPLFLVVGVVGFLWCRAEVLRGIGQALLALGFVFLAVRIISTAAGQLTADPDLATVLALLSHRHGLLFVFAAGLTLATQSSTATIGLAIALAEAGVGTPAGMLSFVLGTNLGLGLTAIVAGWSTSAGRQLAMTNLLLKAAVALPVLLTLDGVTASLATSHGDVARLAANAHTGFNVLVALLGTVFTALFGRLMIRARRSAPHAGDSLFAPATHLDPAALSSPVFALANAARETLQLAGEVKAMLASAWRAYREHDRLLARQVQKHDDQVDAHHAAIKQYLSRIPTDAMSPRDRQFHFGLLHFATQLESIADVIEKIIARDVVKRADVAPVISDADRSALAELQHRVMQRFERAILVLTTRETAIAREFQQEGEELKNWCIEAQRLHYERLTGEDVREQEASTHFLELFNALRRISGQLNTIGHTILIGRPG